MLFSGAERVDLADLLSIDSYTGGDFKFLLKSLVGDDTPYIFKGFDVIDPNAAIGGASVSIRVADSVVYYPSSDAGSFFFGLEEGNANALPLVPELRKSATNYVYLTLTTFETSQDARAFWDPDKDGGQGGEFTQGVNTESVLKVEVGVSTASFPEGTVPVAKIVLDANFITSITDTRDMMFRLGSGGINPDPFAQYAWRQDPSSTYARQEPSVTMTSALDPNPFQGGDKNIQSLKEWMDAIMTKLAELGGTTFWYEDTGSFGMINLFLDVLGSNIKSKGKWLHDATTSGKLYWSEDISISSLRDNRDVLVRAGNKTLDDQQVMYIELTRDQEPNSSDINLDWINGSTTVNGSLTAFENLSKGDWIKKSDDPDSYYVRVEEFYAGLNLGGGTTTPALALSVLVSDSYAGTTGSRKAVYQKGIYASADVKVADRNDTDISDIGGNFYWLAHRSDVVQNISDITTTTLSLDIANHDGITARCTINGGGNHGLVDGQAITVVGGNFAGTYKVEVESVTDFIVSVSGGPHADETAVSSHYAVVTTSSTTSNGTELNSANHTLEDGNQVIIAGTTNYNQAAPGIEVKVLSPTTFSVPVGSALANETSGSSTLVKMKVRSESGASLNIVQGESVNIGEIESDAIKAFIGMADADTHPFYSISPSYNTLDGQANYNADATDNLTERASKLTAMMADKAQDKTVKLVSNYTSVSNTTNGSDQDITFSGGTGTATVIMPSSANNGTIGLSGTLTLAENQAAYYQVDRNAAFSLADLTALTVVDIDSVPLDENTLVFAYRLADTTIYLWNNEVLEAGSSIALSTLRGYVQQNKTVKLVKGGDWSWNLTSSELANSASAFIQVGGLAEDVNEIAAQTISLTSDGQSAYVTLKRTAGASILTVNVADIASVPQDDHTFIVARRVDNVVLIGDSFFALADGDNWTINENLRVLGDITIEGDATINGTTTTINTETLDVEDANITINKNGNQATANSEDAGLTVEMSDATDAKIGYDSSTTSKFKAGEVGSESEIITVDHTQDLENKTAVSMILEGQTQLDDPIEEEITTDNTTTGANATIAALPSPIIRLTDAALESLGALAAQVSGKVITIMNVTGDSIEVENDNGATAAQGILTGTDNSITLANDASLILKYDDTSSRWRVVGGTGAGGGGAGSSETLLLFRAFEENINLFTVKSIDSVLPDFEGSATLDSTLSIPTSGGEALFTDKDANKVFQHETAAGSQYDAFGFEKHIPAAIRGKTLTFEKTRRSFDTSGDSRDGDYMVWIWDKTNGFNSTTSSSGAIAAGGDIIIADNAGKTISVGDKCHLGPTGFDRLEAHVTSVVDNGATWTITIDQDVTLTSGDRFATGIRTDVLTTIPAADDDTDKTGEKFKFVFTTEKTTEDVVIMVQQLTDETDVKLFFDNVLVSSDLLKTVSATRKPKIVEKFLTSTVNSTGNVSDLAFENLVIGRKYDLEGVINVNLANGTENDKNLVGSISNGGTSLQTFKTAASNVFNFADTLPVKKEFIASAETITFNVSTITNTVINPGENQTYLILKEVFETNDVVIVESTESVISELKDEGEIVLSATTTAPTFGTTPVNRMRSRRVGDSAEISYNITQTSSGANGSGSYLIPLPSGLIMDANKIDFDTTLNTMQSGATVFGHGTITSGDNGTYTAVEIRAYNETHMIANIISSISDTGTSGAPVGEDWGTVGGFAFGAAANIVFKANIKVPIAGWDANPKPLLAFPMVDYSWQNEFSAKITNNGTAEVFSSNADFIDTGAVSRTINGTVEIPYKAGFFSEIPAVTVTINDAGESFVAQVIASSTSSVTVTIRDNNSPFTLTDQDFDIKVSRQGDHRSPGNATAIIAQPTAYIKEVQASGVASTTSLVAGSYETNTLNRMKGEISAAGVVSLSGNQFTLKPGKYDAKAQVPITINHSSSGTVYDVKCKIFNVTDSKDVELSPMIRSRAATSSEIHSFMLSAEGGFTITKETTFEIRTRTSSTTSNISIGDEANFGDDEIFTQVSITRKA